MVYIYCIAMMAVWYIYMVYIYCIAMHGCMVYIYGVYILYCHAWLYGIYIWCIYIYGVYILYCHAWLYSIYIWCIYIVLPCMAVWCIYGVYILCCHAWLYGVYIYIYMVYIYISGICSYTREITEDFTDSDMILSSLRFQENLSKDILDLEIFVNDEEIVFKFVYPRK